MPNTSRLLTKKQIISLLLIICTGIVATFWFLGCNKTSFENGSNNSLPGDEKTLPKPTDGTTPADHSPLDNYYIATGVLRDAGSFVGNTTGLSTSLGITQEIKAGRTVLGKDVFKESYSFGVKKVGMQFYVSGKSYVMRDTGKMSSLDSPDWSNSTPYKVSEETFVGKFGGKPLGICNYIVEDDTVLDGGKYLGLEDGLHAFRYDFDTSKATTKMLREMLTMSGMESSFTRAAITVYMDSDWVVKKTTTDCEYVVAYGMVKPSCTESITEVFTALGEKTPLPLADVFSPYLDAEETELTNKEPTALDYIMSGFGAYMAGTPLVASVETSGLVSLKGAASVNIDINNLSNIKARVQIDELGYDDLKLNDVFVVYSDDTVYIKYADLRAKGTISDAKELVKKLAALIKKPTQDDASGGEASGGLLANLDASALLDSMTLTCEDGKATVGITIPLGDVTVNATLEFTDGDTVTFLSAAATICKADGSELLAATILPVESAEIPELEGKYYDLVPLVNELIDDEGNIKLRLTIDTDIADSLGDAISGAISGAITDITDGKTEFVEADKKPISVLAAFNIRTKRLTANVLGIKLMLDLDTKMVYAECGGAKLLLDCGKDFANVQSILEKLAPTIRTFVDDFEPNVKLDLDLMTTIEKLVKAIDGKPDESGVTLSLPVTLGDSEADVTIRLDASETSGYSLGGVKVTLGGTVIIAKIATSVASAPAVFDEVGMIKPYSALKAAGYVGLNEVIDSFADTINNICTAENLIVDLGKGCEVSLGGTTIALSGNIKVAGVNKKTNNGVIKVNADLVVTITKNGSAKTYRIIVIYTTPLKNGDKGLLDGETPHYSEETTTDENGNVTSSKRTVIRPNAYFKLDRLNGDGSSTNEPVIGTFSTANIKETMNTLKTIYDNMPELQGALSFAIPESKDGKFHMPSIEDVGKLVGGLTFDKDGKRLNVSIKVSSLIHDEAMSAKMSEPITVSLLADADGDKSATLGVVVGLAAKGDNGAKPTTVKLNGTANTAEAIDHGVFTYRTDENPDRTSDFSSIDTLLGALAATSANDHFELDGTMKVLLYKPVKIECKIDVINKKTYATLKVTREHVALVSLWQDYSGTTTVYFDGSTDTVYMNCDYYEAKVVGIQYKGTHKNVNYKFTKEEFTSKLADILLKNILPINESFLGDGEKGNTKASIEKIFTKYSYDNNNNFTINLNVGAFTSNVIKDVNIGITKDGQTDMLTTLRLSTKILSVVSIELGHDENGKFVSGASLKCNNFGYKELDDYSKVDGQKATAYSAVVNYRNSNNNFSTYA